MGNRYLICVCSYPMPKPLTEMRYADETARLFFIETKDFVTFSAPTKIYAKGLDCVDEGRMIDPFVWEDQNKTGRYLLFFKQKGVSVSESYDLRHWNYLGHTDGGENACVLVENEGYLLLHSPHNGIGLKKSTDLLRWIDCGVVLPKEAEEKWANGRLTAAFAMKNENPQIPYRYIVFFHGSKKDSVPETHGSPPLPCIIRMIFKPTFFNRSQPTDKNHCLKRRRLMKFGRFTPTISRYRLHKSIRCSQNCEDRSAKRWRMEESARTAVTISSPPSFD